MRKVKPEDVKQGIGIARIVLGLLTDIKDKLPKWLRAPLQGGRDNGLWSQNSPVMGSVSHRLADVPKQGFLKKLWRKIKGIGDVITWIIGK